MNKIRRFKGPLEEIDSSLFSEMDIYDPLFLGEMSHVEKIIYSIFLRKVNETDDLYNKEFGHLDDDIEANLMEVVASGTLEEKLAVDKILRTNNEALDWELFLNESIRARFEIEMNRNLLFIPGHFIMSFSLYRETGFPFFLREKEYMH